MYTGVYSPACLPVYVHRCVPGMPPCVCTSVCTRHASHGRCTRAYHGGCTRAYHGGHTPLRIELSPLCAKSCLPSAQRASQDPRNSGNHAGKRVSQDPKNSGNHAGKRTSLVCLPPCICRYTPPWYMPLSPWFVGVPGSLLPGVCTVPGMRTRAGLTELHF